MINSTNLSLIYGNSVFRPSKIVFVKRLLDTIDLSFLTLVEFLRLDWKKMQSKRLRNWICMIWSVAAKCKLIKIS